MTAPDGQWIVARRVSASLFLTCIALVLPALAHADDQGRRSGSTDACLSYEPAVVTLTGRLEQRTYPGRPNFESVKRGDEPETGFYLRLRAPICSNGDRDSPGSEPQQNVRLVQLVLETKQYRQLRPLLGRDLTLRGRLYPWHTGHHHAPLLLSHIEYPIAGR